MTRDQAYQLLTEHTKSPNLIKHALAVEGAMRHYARKFGEDEERWRIVGLLHDFDYELHPTPDLHPMQGSKILRARGYPEEIIRAVQAHAKHTGVPRENRLEKAIFAVDELCGFVTAVALVHPSKSLFEVEVASVRKKFKDKAFARNVSREDMAEGAELLGLPLEEHIANVLEAMRGIADQLGLGGSP